jgi:hypothetical protein
MILYYAMGGGLGHLTRARAVLHTLATGDRVTIITSSLFAEDRRVVGDAAVIGAPEELSVDIAGLTNWLTDVIDRVNPSRIFLDAFPAGILGELCDFSMPERVPIFHVARLLRWPQYCKKISGAPPQIAVTYKVEPLTSEHEAFLRAWSRQVSDLTLSYTFQTASDGAECVVMSLKREGRPLWLIVHSGPDDEILELVGYACEMMRVEKADQQLVLIAPVRPEGLPPRITHLDLYPASSLYPLADRIITGCGFNAMRETESFRDKHRFYPFPRRYDDQFLRAARRKDEG